MKNEIFPLEVGFQCQHSAELSPVPPSPQKWKGYVRVHNTNLNGRSCESLTLLGIAPSQGGREGSMRGFTPLVTGQELGAERLRLRKPVTEFGRSTEHCFTSRSDRSHFLYIGLALTEYSFLKKKIITDHQREMKRNFFHLNGTVRVNSRQMRMRKN